VQEGNTTSQAGPIATDTVVFSIGMAGYPLYPTGYTNFFNGTIDEVEVSNIARSDDWIKLCYETQKSNQATVLVQENYSDWTYSQNLYLNTKATGANVTNNVVKFPVLIRLDTTNFDFTAAQSSGQDIRFANQDGTHLYYEIEKWDNSNNSGLLWVRVDVVYGNDSSHYVTMYWGNNKVNSMSNRMAVFDTGNGFVGVWHLNNSDFTDATCNHHDATNGSTTDTAAIIGTGRKFVAVDPADSIYIPGLLGSPTTVTMSCWAKVDSIDGAANKTDIVSIGDNCDIRMARATDGSRDSLRCNYYSGAINTIAQPGGANQELHAGWKYLTWMANPLGSSEIIYINGASVVSMTTSSAFSYTAGGANTFFGRHGNGNNFDFGGVLNEVRIEKSARDAYWVKLCYQNQKPGSTFIMCTNENYSQWTYSRKVNINTTPSGANVATTQFKFPVLIRLTSTNFPFSQAQDDGRDIRFASFTGKHLPYQVERWDRINQLAEVWVLADSITGNNGTQYMTMYWGKTGVVSLSNGAAVFDSSNGFQGVWHFNEGTNSTAYDATVNSYDGAAGGGTPPADTVGMIGRCRKYDGTSSYFSCTGTASGKLNFPEGGIYSVSVWVNSDVATAGHDIICKADKQYALHISTGTNWEFVEFNNTLGWQSVGYAPNTGWTHLVGVRNGANEYLYVNGVMVDNTISTSASTTRLTSTDVCIGRQGDVSQRFWDGKIDEAEMSNVARSADWIKLCYQNQKTNQTLVDLEDYGQWASSKKIYINTTVVSPALGAKVAMFPLLVRLDTTMINFNTAQSLGQDVRFSRADGTHFNYEKEKWDQANKNASLWVLVDTILPSSSTQYITMYWGKNDAIDKSNSSAVFDTGNGFAGVWHLNETANTTAGGYAEATANNFTGTGNDMSSAAVSGIAGKAASFDGSNDYIWVADQNAFTPANFTCSFWANPQNLAGGGMEFIDKRAAGNVGGFSLEKSSGSGTVTTWIQTSAWGSGAVLTFTSGWQYVTATYNGTVINAYMNNSAPVSVTHTYGGNMNNNTSKLVFGALSDVSLGANPYNGYLDEIRMEKVVRSADWINLCYWTQKAGISTVLPDTSSEVFLPLKVAAYPVSANMLDSCTIATHNWTLKFSAANKGGGIYWLSPDSMGAATNQLDTNLFTVITNNDSTSKGTASLELLDNSNVFVRLLQKKTIGTLPYSILYTVLGNGKVYIRVSTSAATATTPTNGLEFRISTSGASGTSNYAPSATASSCSYVLHCDPAANRIDPCLVLSENWSPQANSITTGTRYTGIKSSTWSIPGNQCQTWEFMLDIAHRNWNDSTGVGSYISEYRNPDSLAFYSGTPYMEKTWEDHLSGHWKFEEGSGDTAFDNSGSNNVGKRTGGSTWTWTSGKYSGGLSLRSADTVKVVDNAAFDGGSSGFTVMSWINPTATMTSASGIFRKLSGSNGYALTGGSNGNVQLRLNSTTFAGKTNIGSGSWRHVAAKYLSMGNVADTVKLFVDGKCDTVVTGDFSFASSGIDAQMGIGFIGTLDDVRFYNQALNDEQIKTIYQLGWSAGQGMYMVRADNDNAVNFTIDGGTYHRNFPAFQVSNYWNGAALGANNPYVFMNGSQLTYNSDYYVMTDVNMKRLTVGFNRAINVDGTRIYIGSDPTEAGTTAAMPRMYWGSYSWPSSHFYAKNFSCNSFGSSTNKEFYLDFKMDNTTKGNGGEIYRFKTSKVSANTNADTSSTGNLVSASTTTDSSCFSSGKFWIGSHWLRSTANVTATPTYTVVESSAVRVILKINDRKLKYTDSCNIQTWFTLYPTGQIFRWDSVNIVDAVKNIDTVRYDVLETYVSTGTGSPASPIINAKLRGGRYGTTGLQDFAAAFLALNQSDGLVALSIKDTAKIYSITPSPYSGIGVRFIHGSQLANNKKPYQAALYMDIHSSAFNSAAVDSVCKGVQNNIGTYNGRLLKNGVGDTVLGSAGDFNLDGFNEREGAYVYRADNTNTAHFTLLANTDGGAGGDTCRFFPAFRITNYTASTTPQYIFVANQQLVQGFGYNAMIKPATNELILQLNSKYCANTDIYISADRTLAVTMADFIANGGDNSVRLRWHTESEENNLGFFVYRRIKPHFMDSLIMSPAIVVETDSSADSGADKSPGLLYKTRVIGFADTAWKQVNDRIIYGAMAGVSYGKRAYSWLDRGVHNGVQYEYKLVAVDYNNGRDAYDKLAEAMPHRILPLAFELYGNFPNPFRSITCLKFDVPVKSRAMLSVYSIQGRLIRHIVRPDRSMRPGFYRVMWDCKDDNGRVMASGPYIYRFSAPGFAKAKIMIMMK
jgi:hypothetical protein